MLMLMSEVLLNVSLQQVSNHIINSRSPRLILNANANANANATANANANVSLDLFLQQVLNHNINSTSPTFYAQLSQSMRP